MQATTSCHRTTFPPPRRRRRYKLFSWISIASHSKTALCSCRRRFPAWLGTGWRKGCVLVGRGGRGGMQGECIKRTTTADAENILLDLMINKSLSQRRIRHNPRSTCFLLFFFLSYIFTNKVWWPSSSPTYYGSTLILLIYFSLSLRAQNMPRWELAVLSFLFPSSAHSAEEEREKERSVSLILYLDHLKTKFCFSIMIQNLVWSCPRPPPPPVTTRRF